MKIETDRLEFVELKPEDYKEIASIAREMAWNDTINMLLDDGQQEGLKNFNPELAKYRETIVKQANDVSLNLYNKKYDDLSDEEKRNIQLCKKISKEIIPEKNWHINFSQIGPDFEKSAQDFVNGAIGRAKYEPRNGFWLGIKNKKDGKLIGATTISAKALQKDGEEIIGHSGQFIAPEYQRLGYISETKAVMVDFLYKYSARQSPPLFSDKAKFYTTCHALNKGSQALQRKSGAISDGKVYEGGKLHFFANKEDILNSGLMHPKKNDINWSVTLDNGMQFGNIIKMSDDAVMHIENVKDKKKRLKVITVPSDMLKKRKKANNVEINRLTKLNFKDSIRI